MLEVAQALSQTCFTALSLHLAQVIKTGRSHFSEYFVKISSGLNLVVTDAN